VSQGLVAQPGTTIGLRYDYVPQTELRSGTDENDRSKITLPTTREIEQNTYNRYVTATLDHVFNPKWAVNLRVPFVLHSRGRANSPSGYRSLECPTGSLIATSASSQVSVRRGSMTTSLVPRAARAVIVR
jgi:hypothetical protein